MEPLQKQKIEYWHDKCLTKKELLLHVNFPFSRGTEGEVERKHKEGNVVIVE